MGLTRDVYRALEDIVGPEYITEEPAFLDAYCFIWGNEVLFGDRFSARPPAVVLPGSTEEVQAIVKVCNRFKIKFKAHASGWEIVALSAREGFLPMDLRRMNRILEIDEKNNYAVVEPYVSIQHLVTEAIKKGLHPNTVGCGPSASIIATSTAHFGSGASNISIDFGGRVPLGVEWVLPDGEILRLGSLGTGAGWFTGDGPGPSLRGVMRGYGGANGGIGIVTKAAVKLAPWYGPPKIQAAGKPPLYDFETPDNHAVYCVFFPSRERLADFFHLLVEEAIANCAQRSPAGMIRMLSAASNDESWEMMQKGIPQMREGLTTYCATVLLDASSPREMSYREKCFEKILERTEGEIFPLDAKVKGALFLNLLTGQGANRIFRAAGGFIVAPVGDESFDSVNILGKRGAEEIHDKYAKAGRILSTGEGGAWGVAYADYCGHLESLFIYDPADPDSSKAAGEIMAEADVKEPQWGLGINAFEGALSFEESAHKAALPYCLDFLSWIRKVKKAFDPNLVSESSFYVTPEE